MSGLYLITHPLMNETFKLGCSTNIIQRLNSGDYRTMFDPDNGPQLKGWISVDGYETPNEVRYLEQSVFHQLSHKRLFKRRELFKSITIEEVAQCILNLQLVPKIHYDAPIDNGIKESIYFTEPNYLSNEISVRPFQVSILAKMKTFFDTNDRGKLILPCGYGKMYLALFLIRDKFDTAIVACPSLLLCQQFTEVARKICPEYSIGIREGNKWIIITTYQSIDKCKEYNPDLFIVDEAHHTCVTSKSNEEDSMFRSLLSFSAKK
jgi:predicted helicase